MAKITDQFIRALQVPEGEPEAQEIDDDLPGFGVRKQKSGHVSLFVKYSIRQAAAPQDVHVGARHAARHPQGSGRGAWRKPSSARMWLARPGRRSRRPSEPPRRHWANSSAPISNCARRAKFWKPLRPKWLVEVTRYLEKSWQPLHGEPVDKITRQQVRARRDEIVKESGAVSANRALVALSGFCGWAIGEEHIPGTNPTSDTKVLHENKRQRVLSEEELVWIWLCAGDDEFGRIIKLLMLTGQRCREIASLNGPRFACGFV